VKKVAAIAHWQYCGKSSGNHHKVWMDETALGFHIVVLA
jgi:hypothetical protein